MKSAQISKLLHPFTVARKIAFDIQSLLNEEIPADVQMTPLSFLLFIALGLLRLLYLLNSRTVVFREPGESNISVIHFIGGDSQMLTSVFLLTVLCCFVASTSETSIAWAISKSRLQREQKLRIGKCRLLPRN